MDAEMVGSAMCYGPAGHRSGLYSRTSPVKPMVTFPFPSFSKVSYLGHEVHDKQLYIFLEYMPEGR